MANKDVAFVQLLWDIMNRKTGELGKVEYIPQKPAFDYTGEFQQPFPRSTPEEQGISSSYLADFVKEMGEEKDIHIHQLMVLRHGHVIYESGFDPYPAGVWHVTYSMCKSFTNMAIGLLVDDGKLHLDDKLIDVMNSYKSLLNFLKFKDVTIRNLLVMSSGVSFNEIGAISGNDWVNSYFEAGIKFPPGSKFDYNSMNSFMLSAIVTEITGMSMFEFLKERLFTKMGITKVFWEASPQGITKGGWGMFICIEDAVKLGTLYLNHGKWNGEQLISEEWVRESTKAQIQTDKDGISEYGYQIWMDVRPDSYAYNGMLGQNVHVFPDLDMIIATNAGNEEVFKTGPMTDLISKYWGLPYQACDHALPQNLATSKKLFEVKSRVEGTMKSNRPMIQGGWNKRSDYMYAGNKKRMIKRDELHHIQRSGDSTLSKYAHKLRALDGEIFEMHQKGTGLFPLIMQVVHNNYTHGISAIRFRIMKGFLYLDVKEGEQIHTLPIGFKKGKHTSINMNGEDYLVGVKGRIGDNEDGLLVLSLQIAFIEEATERELKIIFQDENHLELRWDEVPGNMIITDTLNMITQGTGTANPLMTNLLGQISPELIKRTLQSCIQPVVHADRITQKAFDEEQAAISKDQETNE